MNDEIAEAPSTVATSAKVKENDKPSWAIETVRMLREMGVRDIQAIIHLSEAPAPSVRFETIDIGDAKWRQTLQLPADMSFEARSVYIRERVVDAAKAYAAGASAAKGA